MKKCLAIILFTVFIIGFIGAIDKIGEYQEAERNYDFIVEKYVDKGTEVDAEVGEAAPEDDRIPQMELINFSELKKQNSDFVAWISFPEEVGIDYPVVKGSDDYYLSHSFNKERNSNGCLMINSVNSDDFSDKHTIIWGHNMKSRKMFGNLREYMDPEYATRNLYFWIYTEQRSLLYKIYSVHKVHLDSPAFWIDIDDSARRLQFENAVKDGNVLEYLKPDGKYDNIVTLATCTSSSDSRLLIHAELIFMMEENHVTK